MPKSAKKEAALSEMGKQGPEKSSRKSTNDSDHDSDRDAVKVLKKNRKAPSQDKKARPKTKKTQAGETEKPNSSILRRKGSTQKKKTSKKSKVVLETNPTTKASVAKPSGGKTKTRTNGLSTRPMRGRQNARIKVKRPIVLVGLMGTGKTTIGRRLAERIDIPFVDSDEEIEKAAQMSVSDIFSSLGEKSFRDGERRVIARLLDEAPKVLATGGGAFINEQTRALIKEKAISIWLDADVNVLVSRTARRDTRPLLKKGDPKEILTKLAKERNPIYSKADIHIQSSPGPHDKVLRQILRALKRPKAEDKD